MCYSNRDLTKPQQSFICYYPCPKCGANIIKKKGGFEAHAKNCQRKYARPKIVCLRPVRSDAQFFTFYDKGSVHCLTKFGLQKYLGIGAPALQKRLDLGWNVDQLLGKEFVEPIENRRNQYSTKKSIEENKRTVGTKEKQDLLRKMIYGKK